MNHKIVKLIQEYIEWNLLGFLSAPLLCLSALFTGYICKLVYSAFKLGFHFSFIDFIRNF